MDLSLKTRSDLISSIIPQSIRNPSCLILRIYKKLVRTYKRGKQMLTSPLAKVSWLYVKANGVAATWMPKKVPVLRYMNFTVEFNVAMSVGTSDASVPAWIIKF
jgi:hypothetical protein